MVQVPAPRSTEGRAMPPTALETRGGAIGRLGRTRGLRGENASTLEMLATASVRVGADASRGHGRLSVRGMR